MKLNGGKIACSETMVFPAIRYGDTATVGNSSKKGSLASYLDCSFPAGVWSATVVIGRWFQQGFDLTQQTYS